MSSANSLWEKGMLSSDKAASLYVCEHMFGIDINPMATDIAAFLLFIHLAKLVIKKVDLGIWYQINNHFLTQDSLKCNQNILCAKAWPKTYGCIIGNPPYGETDCVLRAAL